MTDEVRQCGGFRQNGGAGFPRCPVEPPGRDGSLCDACAAWRYADFTFPRPQISDGFRLERGVCGLAGDASAPCSAEEVHGWLCDSHREYCDERHVLPRSECLMLPVRTP